MKNKNEKKIKANKKRMENFFDIGAPQPMKKFQHGKPWKPDQTITRKYP